MLVLACFSMFSQKAGGIAKVSLAERFRQRERGSTADAAWHGARVVRGSQEGRCWGLEACESLDSAGGTARSDAIEREGQQGWGSRLFSFKAR